MGGPKKSKGKEPKKELQVVSSAEQELLELATKANTECPRSPFWTHGYREEQGRNGRCSRGGPGNGRDECIRQECRDAGLQWGNGGDYDEGQWRDQGNWYFAGWCSCGSHTGNNAAGGEQNVQKTGPKKGEQNLQKLKPGDANEQGPKKSKGKEPKKELQVVSSAEQENMELATKASTECPRRPFWTHGYREEQGRNGRCSRGGPGNGRDECIRQECRDAGLQWGNGGDYDEGQWRDQGNWYFAGWCSCGSHTGNNAAGEEQNVQKLKPGDANEQGPK